MNDYKLRTQSFLYIILHSLPAVKTHHNSKAGTNCTRCSCLHLSAPDRHPPPRSSKPLRDQAVIITQKTPSHQLFLCRVWTKSYAPIPAALTCVSQHTHHPIPPPTGSRAQTGRWVSGALLHTNATIQSPRLKEWSKNACTLTKQLSMEQDTLPARLMSRRGRVASEWHAAYRAAAHPVHEEPALPSFS